MHRERENTLRKTTHSWYIIKDLSHQPSQATGYWRRAETVTNLENDSRKRRFDIKTRGECSNQSCTVSHRTSDVVRSPTVRNRTNVISVNHHGYHREDSPQKKLVPFRLYRTHPTYLWSKPVSNVLEFRVCCYRESNLDPPWVCWNTTLFHFLVQIAVWAHTFVLIQLTVDFFRQDLGAESKWPSYLHYLVFICLHASVLLPASRVFVLRSPSTGINSRPPRCHDHWS